MAVDVKKTPVIDLIDQLGHDVIGRLSEGGVRGVRIPQNRKESCIDTAQNNIRKPQTSLKLPENL